MRKLKLQELGRHTVASFAKAEKVPVVVVLDGIRSAHNVGSIFRSADAMGLSRVVLCGITPQPPSRDINKTAIGATESMPWTYVSDVVQALSQLQSEGYEVVAIEQTDQSVDLLDYDWAGKKIAIVMGNEVDGVTPEALAASSGAVEIEQFGTKHSLNVSVCAGVVLHHVASVARGRRK